MDYQYYVYLIEAVGTGFYKIGITGQLIKDRISEMQTGCPYKLRLVCGCFTNDLKLERVFHKRYKAYREIGEWFLLQREDVKHISILMSLPSEPDDELFIKEDPDEIEAKQNFKSKVRLGFTKFENIPIKLLNNDLYLSLPANHQEILLFSGKKLDWVKARDIQQLRTTRLTADQIRDIFIKFAGKTPAPCAWG